MDPEGVQGTGDSHPGEARKESEGVEGEVSQGLQSGVLYCRMPAEARFSRLPESCSGTCDARPGWLLASQVPRHVRYAVPVGWGRPSHRSAVAWSFRHGINNAILETIAEPADEGQGE